MTKIIIPIMICILSTYLVNAAATIGTIQNTGYQGIIDTNIIPSNNQNYSYEMTQAPYKAFFKTSSNSARSIRYETQGYYFTFDISTSQMKWYNSTLRAEGGMVANMNPLDTYAVINGSTISYNNAWLYTNLTYELTDNMMKELLTMSNVSKPSSTGITYDYFQYRINIYFNSTLKICFDGVTCYNATTTPNTDIETKGNIEFKDQQNQTIYYLPAPTITDNAGQGNNGLYSVNINNGIILLKIRIPKEFLDTATYPVTIDPTIQTMPASSYTPVESQLRNVCRTANKVHIAYVAGTSSAAYIVYANSSDGINFGINTSFYSGGVFLTAPNIDCEGTKVVIAIMDTTNDRLLIRISDDEGSTWGNYSPFNNTFMMASPATAFTSALAGGKYYVAWYDYNITFAVIDSASAGNITPVRNISTAGTSTSTTQTMAMAVNASSDGLTDNVYIIFCNGSDSKTYFINSSDSGTNWGLSAQNISLSCGTNSYYKSSLVLNGSTLWAFQGGRIMNNTDGGLYDSWKISNLANNAPQLYLYNCLTANTGSISIGPLGWPVMITTCNNINITGGIRYNIVMSYYNGTGWTPWTFLTNDSLENGRIQTNTLDGMSISRKVSNGSIDVVWRTGSSANDGFKLMYDNIIYNGSSKVLGVPNILPVDNSYLKKNVSLLNCSAVYNGPDNGMLKFVWYINGTLMLGDWCYQEFANASTDCGGLSTGVYDDETFASDSWRDGDILTCAEALGTDVYGTVNFSIPSMTGNDSYVSMYTADSWWNYTIDPRCLDDGDGLLKMNFTVSPFSASNQFICYDGITPIVTAGDDGGVCETNVYWNINGGATNLTNLTRGYTNIAPTNASYNKTFNISCLVSASGDGITWSSWVNSTNLTVSDAPPLAISQQSYTNGSQQFTITATANDADGLQDITSCIVYYKLDEAKNDTSINAFLSMFNVTGTYDSATGTCTATIDTSDSGMIRYAKTTRNLTSSSSFFHSEYVDGDGIFVTYTGAGGGSSRLNLSTGINITSTAAFTSNYHFSPCANASHYFVPTSGNSLLYVYNKTNLNYITEYILYNNNLVTCVFDENYLYTVGYYITTGTNISRIGDINISRSYQYQKASYAIAVNASNSTLYISGPYIASYASNLSAVNINDFNVTYWWTNMTPDGDIYAILESNTPDGNWIWVGEKNLSIVNATNGAINRSIPSYYVRELTADADHLYATSSNGTRILKFNKTSAQRDDNWTNLWSINDTKNTNGTIKSVRGLKYYENYVYAYFNDTTIFKIDTNASRTIVSGDWVVTKVQFIDSNNAIGETGPDGNGMPGIPPTFSIAIKALMNIRGVLRI